ncbi:MAG: tetratricopeptide repeat protein [Balneolaceae bacterium]|nr:tetratricopeptide repeat protein [Balneolaceae bacterium]
MNHQSDDIEIIKQIDAYLKDQLSEEDVEQLWIKLIKNEQYLNYLETELTVKSIFGENKGEDSSSTGGEGVVSEIRTHWQWIAAAASVVILVVALNLLTTGGPESLREQTIGQINLMNQLEAPLVMRSQKSELSSADSLMNAGFEAALSGNVNRALQMYDSVINRYGTSPVAAEAHLNKGIIRYNNEDYQLAASEFRESLALVTNDKTMQEKAYWYLGNSLINLDKLVQARGAVQQVYELDGTYRKPAFRLLRKLDYELGNIEGDSLQR